MTRALLLDWDGPCTPLFESLETHELVAILGIEHPLEAYQEMGRIAAEDGDASRAAEQLERVELLAASRSGITSGFIETIEGFDGPVGIVSNNSPRAVVLWLDRHGLRSRIDHVQGRDWRNLKPSPVPLILASEALSTSVEDCVFVGDRPSDGVAAERAGMRFVALASANYPAESFGTTASVIDSMAEAQGALADSMGE